jgi:hypothetical protein
LLITVTLAVLASDGCSCQQSNYREASSPDHRYVAIERELNCSALDPYRVTVSIRSSVPRFGFAWLGSSSKEVFAADVSLRNTSVEWLDNGHLKVACTDCEKYGIAERVEAWRDVKISFDVGKAGKGVF